MPQRNPHPEGAYHALELNQELHTADSQVGEIRPLKEIIDDPDPATVKVAQAGRRGARGAGTEILYCVCYVVRLGEEGCMVHGHIKLLALVTPLTWGDRRKALLPEQAGTAHDPTAVALFLAHESLNPSKLLQSRFPDVNAVGGHPDRLI